MAAGLRSMTGFGSARAEASVAEQELRLEVEVRSVNHRHLKLHTRVPEGLVGLIPQVEELVRARAARGTIYLTARQTSRASQTSYRLDRELLIRFHQELATAAGELGVDPPDLGRAALLPGVVREEEVRAEAQAVWPALSAAVDEALGLLDAMRLEEGRGIAANLQQVLTEMGGHADAVEAAAPQAVQDQAERLRARVRALLDEPGELDPQALAREVALLADKSDISEELQRLRSHIDQIANTLAGSSGPVGRKLEFLTQELMRESNTMANKSHDTVLIDTILEIKLCVERIREQVANVE